jgi:hypothetical protein|nr:DUF4288 domain-containing protein [Candidatus Acidoferrales bacterium]
MRKSNPAKLSWFTARCHFKSEVEGKHKDRMHLWQEAFFLVHASSKKDAGQKAKHLARGKKHTYKNFAGDIIVWKFAGVIDVCALEARNFGDGTEVYSRFFSREGTLDTSVRNK